MAKHICLVGQARALLSTFELNKNLLLFESVFSTHETLDLFIEADLFILHLDTASDLSLSLPILMLGSDIPIPFYFIELIRLIHSKNLVHNYRIHHVLFEGLFGSY